MAFAPALLLDMSATCGSVTLRCPSPAEIKELASAVAAGGLDDDRTRENLMAWVDGPPAAVAAGTTPHITSLLDELGRLQPGEMWTAPFSVFDDGRIVGMQSVHALSVLDDDFVISTGSWLLNTTRGCGVGTAARRCALSLMFAAGVTRAETSWILGNAASASVSAKLGYQLDGVGWKPRGDGTDRQVQFAHVTPLSFDPGDTPIMLSLPDEVLAEAMSARRVTRPTPPRS